MYLTFIEVNFEFGKVELGLLNLKINVGWMNLEYPNLGYVN